MPLLFWSHLRHHSAAGHCQQLSGFIQAPGVRCECCKSNAAQRGCGCLRVQPSSGRRTPAKAPERYHARHNGLYADRRWLVFVSVSRQYAPLLLCFPSCRLVAVQCDARSQPGKPAESAVLSPLQSFIDWAVANGMCLRETKW